MSDFDLLIKNGKIATASDCYQADIAIKDGVISQIGIIDCDAKKIINAEENIVTPGVLMVTVTLINQQMITQYLQMILKVVPSLLHLEEQRR